MLVTIIAVIYILASHTGTVDWGAVTAFFSVGLVEFLIGGYKEE